MEEWDPANNDFVLRCNSCWRTNKHVKIIRTSREKYYCEECLSIFDLCHSESEEWQYIQLKIDCDIYGLYMVIITILYQNLYIHIQ
jgi:hypothetical protein